MDQMDEGQQMCKLPGVLRRDKYADPTLYYAVGDWWRERELKILRGCIDADVGAPKDSCTCEPSETVIDHKLVCNA